MQSDTKWNQIKIKALFFPFLLIYIHFLYFFENLERI